MHKVAILDDSEELSLLLSLVFKKETDVIKQGLHIEFHNNPESFMNYFPESELELVVLDLCMGYYSGLDILNFIRDHCKKYNKEIPKVIFMSSFPIDKKIKEIPFVVEVLTKNSFYKIFEIIHKSLSSNSSE